MNDRDAARIRKLKTVLREKEFRDFVLDRAIALVMDMATRVA